jgi:hypothetical protein
MKGLGPLGMHWRGARCYSDCQEKIFESMVTEFSGDHGAEQVQQQVGTPPVVYEVGTFFVAIGTGTLS